MNQPEVLRGGTDELLVTIYPVPTEEDINTLAKTWDLHPLLIEDLTEAGQRPKLERYGEVVFLAARSAAYQDEEEAIAFFEFHLLFRPGDVAILCQDHRWIDGETDFGSDLLDNEQLLSHGPHAVAYHLLDRVVDSYRPVLDGLENDKEEIESQVFDGDTAVAERIYRLSREIVDVQHAIISLSRVVESLRESVDNHQSSSGLHAYLKDVSDHLAHESTEVQELREALGQILNVNATLVAQRQNEDMKKISGWAAILFAPTLIGAIYGMNFKFMPELQFRAGYPLALAGMLVFAVILYGVFKWKKWM